MAQLRTNIIASPASPADHESAHNTLHALNNEIDTLGGVSALVGSQGPVGMVWMGAWDLNTSYGTDDGVHHEGRAFIALQPSTGVEPPTTSTSSTEWGLLADKGTDGGAGSAFVGELVTSMRNVYDRTDTAWSPRYDPTVFDLSKYDPAASIHFRVDLSQTAAGSGLVEVRLSCMSAGNAVVAGSTLSATVAQFNHAIVESGDLRAGMQAGQAIYSMDVRVASGFTGQFLSPQIIARHAA